MAGEVQQVFAEAEIDCGQASIPDRADDSPKSVIRVKMLTKSAISRSTETCSTVSSGPIVTTMSYIGPSPSG